MDKDVAAVVIDAIAENNDSLYLKELGKRMFDMYTAHGFPPDMFIAQVRDTAPSITKSQLVFIINEYHTQFLAHRRLSGINDNRIDKIRKKNRDDMERFIATGELGIY